MLSRFFKKEKSNFKTQAPKSRKLRMESLEDRALLSVMPFEYDALRDANPEIGLPADRSDVNIVELTELTRAALQKAVDLAATTPQDDLIYVRTTEDASTIDLIEGVAISIDAENFGSLTIAASKETPVNFSVAGLDGAALTINAGVVVLANANFVDVDAAERGESAAAVVVAEGKGRYVPANVSAFAAQDADAERFSASRLDAKTQTNDAERLQNNYAVLFYGGGDPQANDERYLANLQDLYEVLTVGWGLPKENIYILYAGGVNASTYVSATPDQSVTYRFTDPAKGEVETRELVRSDLSFAKGSPVCAATAANLDAVCASVAAETSADSRVLFFSYDHGAGLPGQPSDRNDYLCGWNENIAGKTVASSLFRIDAGYVTTVHAQCFGGGILDDIQNPSSGDLLNSSPDGTWYGVAAANHYETSKVFAVVDPATGRAVDWQGFAQAFTKAIDPRGVGAKTGAEAFAYAKAHTPNVSKDAYSNNGGQFVDWTQHPWAVGEAFEIFASSTSGDSDVGDTIATATPRQFSDGAINVDEEIGNGPYGAKDVDVYKVYLSADRAYDVELAAQTGQKTVDTYLRLVDSTGATLACDDDSGSESYSKLAYRPTTSGYYYVAVMHYGNKSVDLTTTANRLSKATGFYSLSILESGGAGISGCVVDDANNNGVQDAGETYLIDQLVWLDQDRDGIRDENEPSVLTDETGFYKFANLDPGEYYVRFQPTQGWRQTFPLEGEWNADDNLIVNGAFEDSIAASGCYALGTGDNRIKGWSVTGTVFLHNQRVCREFSDVWAGESGNETFCVDLQRSYSGGTISQTFATVPGQRYVLTYVVAGNPRGGAAVKRYSISAGDSTFTGTFDTTGKSANNMGWESRTWSFVATAAQTTLAFTGLGYGDYGATIDDVCVAPALESTRYPTGYTVVLQNGQSANNRDFGAYRDPNTTQLNKPTITATATSFESIALTIGSVANASGYEVEYSTSPSFTESRTATQTFASAGKKTLTGLAAETTYYVRVKAIGKGTYVDSIWADATSATTWPPATQLSAPSLSVSAASSFSLNVAIGAVENASGYTLQYSTSSSFTSSTTATKAYSSAGTYTLTGLAANATYYVRVLAKGDGASYLDSEWSSVKSATTPKAALTAVTISGTPKVGETLTANVSPSGATATFQWYCGANPNAITTVISGATSKTFAITSAYVGKYLKVVATGIGDYSGSVAATTAVAVVPNATRLATPTLNVVAESSSALSVTVGAVANATSHTLEYSTSQDFSASTTRRWTWLVAGTRELDGLSAGTTYYLRVRANGDGTSYRDSEWSSVKTATTKSVAANKPNLQPGAFETDWDGGIALSASYNDWPTRHATTFSVNDTIYICGSVKNVGDATAEPFAVEFALRDANGTPLQTYTWMRAEVPARHWYWARSAAWSFKNLAAGTYTVTATVDSKNVVAESDETDNVYVKTFRVVGAAKETPSLVVTTNLDAVDAYDGKISLREAILYAETNAALGDTITFAASTKGKTITLNGADLEVNRAGLKIDASSLYDAATETPGVTIDADGRSRGFNVKAGTKAEPVTIKGLTITGGSARDGGGIYVSEAGALALYDSALIGNRATSWGGGGLCADGPATVVNCRFVENEARDGGGLCVATGATLTLADSTFIGNAAFGSGWDGGAIRVYADCVATIDGCEIRENEAAKGGGISVATGGKATISNSTIADNVATVYGGGGLGINGEATISNSTITGNSSPTYGGGLNVNGVASIDGSVISGNTATYGGGIHSDGTSGVLSLTDSTLSNNVATSHGGGLCVDGRGTVENVVFSGNSATYGGGIHVGGPSGVLTLTDSTLSNNVATSHGGGLCVDGRGTVENVVFSGNSATYGGGIHVGGSQSLTVVASEIIENTATNEGGGISVTDDAALTLTDSLVDANEITAGAKNVYGGGIYAAGTLTVENSDITNNVANGINDAFGGGIYAKKTSTLLNSNVSNNLATGKFAVRGGGVDARGTLIATDSTFDGNVATHTTNDYKVYGGGIYFDASAGTATLTNCVLTNNAATTDGGAFRAQTGTATLTGCAISNNSATYGGGVGVSGTASATLTDCSITENVASGYGGGVALFDEAKAALTNCVVSNNTATRGAGLLNRGADATATLTNVAITGNVASSYGGGVYSEGTTFCANVLIAGNSGSYGGAFYGEAGTATFVNATLTGNSATKNGGGIYEYSASTTLCNAIVAQNAPNDVRIASKASIVGRNSLSSFTAWNAGEKNYVYNASLPLFVDAANGDYALADGSQAINKGNDAYAVDAEGNALQTDLAGRARLVGAVDLGAYEYRALETPSLVVTTNLDVVDAYDDKISLREAIRYAASNATLGDAITFAPSLKGATIKLAGERLEISQAGLTVDATSLYDATTQKPGVTVDADGKSRVFYLTDGTTSQPIAIKGLTITGGKTDDAGGGVYASGATTFANCVVSGNAAAYGGGVYASGATTFANCVVSGNAAAYGGGVSAYGGGVELVNCEISGNTATNYGGGVCVSNATFTNCSISGNAASKYGGGVYVSSYGAAMLCNTMIALNYGGEVAGALSSDSGNNQIGGDPKFVVGPVFDGEGNLTNADSLDLRLTAESWAVDRGVNDYISDVETDLAGNARVKRSWASSATVDIGAYEYQGTLAKTPETPSLVVTTNRDGLDDTDGEISLREAILYAETNANLGSTITFATTLKDKTIVLTDGELFISRGLTLDASKIYNATTRTPGIAIDADEKSRVFSASGGTKEKPIALIGLTIAGGKTSGVGGGVCFYCGTATFTDCAIVDNAASSGGGVYLEGSATFTNCSISGNVAASSGGGAYLEGSATFTNCSISDNVAKKSGGGVKMADTQKSCVFVNCLIKGNAAANKGGGVSLSWTESASFTNCSISANTATSGGGVHIEGVTSLLAPALAPGKMTLRNTIVALNTASSSGADINRTGYKTTINACNALSSYSAWSNASADGVVNYVYDETLPLFKDAANGDYTLADGSQAINKGNDACAVDANGQKLTLDATGKPRFNGTVDLGAYEYGVVETASLTVTTTLDVVDAYDGKISLREAIRYAASNATLGDAITFAASLKGATIKLSGAQLEISQAGLTVDATSLYDAATQTPGIAINADGKSRVFSINGSATLVGLTLRNGVAEAGGGVYVARGAALTMRQCVAVENAATRDATTYGGGGVYVAVGATATIVDSSFSANSAFDAGAVYVGGTTTIVGSTFTGNSARSSGGAIFTQGAAATTAIVDSSFVRNSTLHGGALSLEGTTTLTNVTVAYNSAFLGGGVYANATAYFAGCVIFDNGTSSGKSANGGGVYVGAAAQTTYFANTLIALNGATGNGGGVAVHTPSPTTFVNCAIVGNHIARFGGGVYAHGGNVAFYNTINVDNTAGADPASADVYNYRGTATACNVLSRFTGWNGGGNNYVYNGSQPLFKNPANGDYTLAANSQALEKGNNVYVVDATGNALPTDLTGAPRFNGTVDLGPYEYWREERLSAPSLTVSAASSSALSVAIGGVANASSYALQYSTTADFTAATTVTETYASAGTYTPTGLSANTTYYVRVKAVGDGSTRLDSAWSSVKFATTAKVALTDVTLRGTAKVGETLTASVSPNGATASYRWYCGTNATDVTTEVSGATSATFTLTSAYVGAYLKVVATGTGDYCGSVSATVDLVPPAAPTNVKFGPYDGASRQATLVWADNATNEARYEARYSVDGGATWTTLANLAANATSRVCGDLSDGKTYLFQIRAVAANGLASDWSGASLLVPPAPAFGASEYVVEQNGAFYLAANDASDAALTYYWDLSGSEVEDSSNFIERDSGFWTSVDELGFGVGEHTIRLRSRDANGNFSATAAATLRVVATTPTIHATASTFADGAALRLDLRATTPDGSPIARWRFDWGDGQTSDFAELSDALTAAHYYAPTEADAVYEASLTVFGAGFEFSCALTSHSVPGRGAASQTAQETALSDVASSSCVAEAFCDIETQNAFESAIAATFGTSSDAVSRSRESWSDSNVAPASNATRFLGDLPKITTRRVDVNALNDGETRRGFERRESGVFTASSAFAALLEEFAELDFFIDEDDFDALASRRVRR